MERRLIYNRHPSPYWMYRLVLALIGLGAVAWFAGQDEPNIGTATMRNSQAIGRWCLHRAKYPILMINSMS